MISTSSHGGLLFPLDMFRPTMLAAALAENLLSKARNIIDATLVLARDPASPVVLARIEGSVIGDDPAAFWKEYADLAMFASQVLPRQVFLYYATGGLDRHEGFIVAQRGQPIAADDSEQDNLPPSSPDKVWPVERLCEQMQITLDDLADGFPEGYRVELSLMEPSGDDQSMLMALAGQGPEDEGADAEEPESHADTDRRRGGRRRRRPPAAGDSAPSGATAQPSKPKKITIEQDTKRRAAEKAAEAAELEQRASEVTKNLPYELDELGVVVAVKAELSETNILRNYLVSALEDRLPDGLPRSLQDPLRGKAIDFAVKVDFLSEVFLDNRPLSRPEFDARATTRALAGVEVQQLEVLAPRLRVGTLFRLERANVFISRRASQPIPEDFVLTLLRA
ncbi:MAG: hypothetical protein H6713_10820 [Myxococcales bacterium]|nr:hypothetical protein [Myxococcales bacterium]MCB9750469.1 hypothetical protein [Myxococcales bacterium]